MQKDYFSRFPFAELSSQDGNSKIKFCSHGYQFPEEKTGYDADWQRSYLYLSIPCFRAEIDEPMFEGTSLQIFLNELQNLSALKINRVEFKPTEPYIDLKFTLNSRKKVDIKGSIWNVKLECDATLEFEFETDLTFIDIFISGLKNILAVYPPRK
jgi:hypothetical protein